jgi:hypothetical protein
VFGGMRRGAMQNNCGRVKLNGTAGLLDATARTGSGKTAPVAVLCSVCRVLSLFCATSAQPRSHSAGLFLQEACTCSQITRSGSNCSSYFIFYAYSYLDVHEPKVSFCQQQKLFADCLCFLISEQFLWALFLFFVSSLSSEIEMKITFILCFVIRAGALFVFTQLFSYINLSYCYSGAEGRSIEKTQSSLMRVVPIASDL